MSRPPYTPHHASRRRRRRARRRGQLVALGVAAALTVAIVSVVWQANARRATRPAPPSVGLAHAPVGLTPIGVGHEQLGTPAAAVARLAKFGLPIYCGGKSKPMVALTFDDGPGPYTQLAMTKLRQHHARATFFLVGKSIRAWPGVAGLEKAVGAIGDHTLTHPFLPALSQSAMAAEIAGAQTLIERAARRPVMLFRPPYEGRTPQIDAEARKLGMLEVLWNVDSGDSLGADYAGIEHNVIAGLHPGAIILMHENRGQTIRALPAIFAALRRTGLRAVTVPRLVAEDPPTPRQLRAGTGGCA